MELRRDVKADLGTGSCEHVKVGGGRGHMRSQGEMVGGKEQGRDGRF